MATKQEVIDALVQVVLDYAFHDEKCALINYLNDDADCTCGFYKALAATPALLAKVKQLDAEARHAFKHRVDNRFKKKKGEASPQILKALNWLLEKAD